MKLSPFAFLFALFALSCASQTPAARFPMMVADMDPVPVGSFYGWFDRAFGRGLNAVRLDAVFHPRLNAVSLEFRHELITYRQFWDEPARRAFAAALEMYNADFEARALVDRHRRTRDAYGRVNGRLEWRATRITATRVSRPVIELGYRFRDVDAGGRWESRPFFATLMRSARSEGALHGEERVESRQIRMYFTRAQAAELADVFEQGFLLGAIGARGPEEGDAAPPTWEGAPADEW